MLKKAEITKVAARVRVKMLPQGPTSPLNDTSYKQVSPGEVGVEENCLPGEIIRRSSDNMVYYRTRQFGEAVAGEQSSVTETKQST